MPHGRNAPVSCSMVPRRPRILPSASTAIATFQYWSRSWVDGEEMLAPVLLPFHRAAELHRRGRDHRLLGIERRLGAEAAADERRDHADRFEIALEQIGERAAAEMRRLRRRPHRQHVGGRRRSSPARRGLPASWPPPRCRQHLLLEHMRRVRERGVDVAVAHRHERRRRCSARSAVHARRAGLHRVAGVAHRRQHARSRPRPRRRRPRRDSGCPRSPRRRSGRRSRPRRAPARAACAAS